MKLWRPLEKTETEREVWRRAPGPQILKSPGPRVCTGSDPRTGGSGPEDRREWTLVA